MTNYREVLRLSSLGLNRSQIADSLGVSRTTVIHTLQRAAAQGIDWAMAEPMSDKALAALLFPGGEGTPIFKVPDFESIHKELMKPGVTQQLIWMEYSEECRATGEIPFGLTAFKTHYREFAAQKKATMHIVRKPGEIMEVDWAGQTAHMTDPDNGEDIEVFVFVSVLPYSGYAYAEAFPSMDQEAWTQAHVNAYSHFGGVTLMLVPDNLKTGVTKHTRSELILNRSYHELAEHYGTAIMPTRVRSPKDKATVEGSVGNISTYILAAIRNQKFFTLRELNEAIKERLHAFNHKPFQRKEGSRASWFAEEKVLLLPLPRNSFELGTWKVATVAFNYHIGAGEQYYSVPYELIKCKVDVRLTHNIVEVFFEGSRVCSHVRLHGRKGQYSTEDAHMPPNHQQYLKWDGDRFRRWAEKAGPNTANVVNALLAGHKVEQQGYRSCMALLKLGDQYSPERLENACIKALEYSPQPNYKTVQLILRAGKDKIAVAPAPPEAPPQSFTRGSEYYAKGAK
jgi:transposase